MKTVRRVLPYTRQLVLYALYDILDSEESEYDKAEDGCIAAEVTVYGNKSGFALYVSEKPPATVLTVQMSSPCEGLSEKAECVRFVIWRIVWSSCSRTRSKNRKRLILPESSEKKNIGRKI